jgi:hypothetical protein
MSISAATFLEPVQPDFCTKVTMSVTVCPLRCFISNVLFLDNTSSTSSGQVLPLTPQSDQKMVDSFLHIMRSSHASFITFTQQYGIPRGKRWNFGANIIILRITVVLPYILLS